MIPEGRDARIDALFFAASRMERMEAQLDLEFDEGMDLRALFDGFIRYLAALASGERAPRDENVTPFLIFHNAFEPLLYMLWMWENPEAMIETLIEMQNDSDPRYAALATVSLAVGNARWQQERVEIHLRDLPRSDSQLLRAAKNFALVYMPFSHHIEQKKFADMTLLQQLEQYAGQLMSGLVRQPNLHEK
jgi:hypothetical protein